MRFETFVSRAIIVQPNKFEEYGIHEDALYAMVYPGGSWIIRSDSDKGSWCLTIENHSACGDDILGLEAELYCWAADNGTFDSSLDMDMLFKWMVERDATVNRAVIDKSEYVCRYLDCQVIRRNVTHNHAKSALIAAWCRDTLREYFHNIDRSVYNIEGLTERGY